MARLDDTLLRSQIEQQAALATQLAVQAERAEAEAARVKDLDNASVFAQEQIEARRFAAKAARAQADAQAASARDLRTREERMTIRAPYAGLVIERNVRVGDMAGGGNPWFRIAKDGQIELAADVSENALSRLEVGSTAKVILADGTEVDGNGASRQPAGRRKHEARQGSHRTASHGLDSRGRLCAGQSSPACRSRVSPCRRPPFSTTPTARR